MCAREPNSLIVLILARVGLQGLTQTTGGHSVPGRAGFLLGSGHVPSTLCRFGLRQELLGSSIHLQCEDRFVEASHPIDRGGQPVNPLDPFPLSDRKHLLLDRRHLAADLGQFAEVLGLGRRIAVHQRGLQLRGQSEGPGPARSEGFKILQNPADPLPPTCPVTPVRQIVVELPEGQLGVPGKPAW